MDKSYKRVNWSNDTSKGTFLNDTNLNVMDKGIDTLDDRIIGLNDRILELEGYEEDARESWENAEVSEANAKTSENNAKTSEANAKVYMEKAFATTPEGYEELVENVSLLDIAKSTDLTLKNSKLGGLKINHIKGATEQKTLTGKNLYNVKNITTNNIFNSSVGTSDWITVNVDNTSGTTSVYANYFSSIQSLLKENTEYALVIEVKEISSDKVYLVPCDASASNDQFTATPYVGTKGITVLKVTTKESFDSIPYCLRTFCVIPAGVYGKMVYRISILEDTTVTADTFTYEPYCGGTASPNPSYPQAIQNTGDCVEMIQGAYKSSDGTFTNSTTWVSTKNKIPCENGDEVNISLESENGAYIMYYNESGYVKYNSRTTNTEHTFTIPSGVTYFMLCVGSDNGNTITPDTVGKISLTVNGKYVTGVKSVGKNICDVTTPTETKNGLTVTNDDKKVSISGTATADTVIRIGTIYVTKNMIGKTYTHVDCFGRYTLKDGTTKYATTVTITEDIVSLIPYYQVSSGNSVNITLRPMIYESHLDDSYEPYTESTAYIYTDEPIRDSDVVFNDKGVWKVERNRAVITLDGSSDEDNRLWALSAENNERFIHYFNTSKQAKESALSSSLCNGLLFNVDNNDHAHFRFSHSSLVYHQLIIYVPKTLASTIDEFNSWLASNPLTFEYTLATPTYEVLDTESQLALNSLETFDTVTYLEVDSRVQPSEVEVEYGTSKVGGYTLKSLLNSESNAIKLTDLTNTVLILNQE